MLLTLSSLNFQLLAAPAPSQTLSACGCCFPANCEIAYNLHTIALKLLVLWSASAPASLWLRIVLIADGECSCKTALLTAVVECILMMNVGQEVVWPLYRGQHGRYVEQRWSSLGRLKYCPEPAEIPGSRSYFVEFCTIRSTFCACVSGFYLLCHLLL